MSENQRNVHYYGERGLVNCLIQWLQSCNERDLKDFLSLLNYEEQLNEYKLEIYCEYDFNDFGSPDLIIVLENHFENNRIESDVFFIEAKITGFVSASSDRLTTTRTTVKYKNNASKIDVQLLLRKRLMCAQIITDKKTQCDYIQQEENEYKSTDGRLLKKSQLVEKVKIFKKATRHHYIALVMDEKEDESNIYTNYFSCLKQYKLQRHEFQLLTWNRIIEKFNNIPGMKETWEDTFDNKKQKNPKKKKENK